MPDERHRRQPTLETCPAVRPRPRDRRRRQELRQRPRAARHQPRGAGQGEVTCVLGDNGAGKSTLIKIIAGLHEHTEGDCCVDGEASTSPRRARPSTAASPPSTRTWRWSPLMAVWRNFFLGSELTRQGPFAPLDVDGDAGRSRDAELRKMGIVIRDLDQPVGNLSGGAAAVRGDRPGGLLRRAGADPGRADRGARRQAVRRGAEVRRRGARRGARASSSSPTTRTTPTWWATTSSSSSSAGSCLDTTALGARRSRS